MIKCNRMIPVLCLFIGPMKFPPAAADEWKQVLEKDGIKVYTKRVPGIDIDEFRGPAVTSAPIEAVGELLRDVDPQGHIDFRNGKGSVFSVAMGDPSVPPRKGFVRVKEVLDMRNLERPGPDQTRVAYTIKANPGGSIPPSIANLSNKNLPLKTLRNMRMMVLKEKYIELAKKNHPSK